MGSTEAIPEIIAHRGFQRGCPENTLLAFRMAIAQGAKFVETDVRLTADRVPVLFHDSTLDRLCGVPGRISESTWDELQNLSAHEPMRFGKQFEDQRIASLAQFCDWLATNPDVTAFVELKPATKPRRHDDVRDAVLPVLQRVRSQVAVISYSANVLRRLRQRDPDLPIGIVSDDWPLNSAARDLAPDYVFCDVNALPTEGKIDVGPARLAVYEVSDWARAIDLAAQGVKFVETFDAASLLSERQRDAGTAA